ncbi:MAG: hypothetical protein V4628_18390 [Pseudomonadota bacterium]
MSELTIKQFIEAHAGWDADNWSQADLDNLRDFVKRKEAEQTDFAAAYAGAREDLLIWKNRALVAESQNRPAHKDDLTDGQIISTFRKMFGGDTGAWRMYQAEIVALYRSALLDEAKRHSEFMKGKVAVDASWFSMATCKDKAQLPFVHGMHPCQWCDEFDAYLLEALQQSTPTPLETEVDSKCEVCGTNAMPDSRLCYLHEMDEDSMGDMA